MFNLFTKKIPVIVDPLGDRKRKLNGDIYSLDPVVYGKHKAIVLQLSKGNTYLIYIDGHYPSVLAVPQAEVKLDLGEFQEAIIARRKSEEMQQELYELTNRADKIKNEASKLSKLF